MSKLRKLEADKARLLAKSGIALYRVLLARRGPMAETFEAELGWLAKRAGLKYQAAYKALRKLKEAGLVETHRVHCEIESRKWDKEKKTVNRYTVHGKLKRYRGVDSFEVPPSFFVWAKTRKPQGRPKKKTKGSATSPQKNLAAAPNKKTKRPPKKHTDLSANFTEKSKDAGELHRKEDERDIYKEQSLLRNPPLGGSLEEDSVSPPKTPSLADQTPTSDEPSWAALRELMGRPSAPRDRRMTFGLPPLDPVPKELNNLHESLTETMTDRQLVARTVRAYNYAHLEVFGEMGHAYGRIERSWNSTSDALTRSKFYPQLLAAAKVLLDKGIRPQSWACWRMQYYADNNRKCPPVHVIFGAKMIASKSGWFRKAYDEPASWKSAPTPLNREQHHRRREAVRRRRGFESLVGFPRWYVEMREDECSRGIECPLSLYPRVRERSRQGVM